MKKFALLKTGSTHGPVRDRFGDFEDWFLEVLGPNLNIRVIHVAEGEDPGEPADWDGILVTGSPAMVSDREPWSEATGAWLARAVREAIPLLGVCYGHQLLAHALGGLADNRAEGRESGTFDIRLLPEASDDPLFSGLPECFPAHLTHRQSVLRLPDGAVPLARSDNEPHQAFRIGDCAWGVQFHPEFTPDVMVAYLETQAAALKESGQSPEALLSAVREAAMAASLLNRFASYVESRVKQTS